MVLTTLGLVILVYMEIPKVIRWKNARRGSGALLHAPLATIHQQHSNTMYPEALRCRIWAVDRFGGGFVNWL
jgi:hypothetical protein